MKTICLALFALAVTACGQANGNPSAAVSPASSATPTAATSASAQPSPTSQSSTLFAVLEAKGTGSWSTYNTVAIAGLDGYARAKTTFAPMPVPNLGCMGAIIPPSAHVAGGKVYFADAHGVIRSLGVDGKVTTVATFPMTSSQQMLSFAVSPDGARVVGTVFTAPKDAFSCAGPDATAAFTFDAYSAASGHSSQLIYHQSWTSSPNVMALTGWDAVGPYGTYPTVWASQGGGPGSTLGVFVRIDATTLKPGAQFSDPSQCQVWDSVASGAFVCTKDAVTTGGGTPTQKSAEPVSVRRADGTEMWPFTMTSTNPGSSPLLAPDTQHVVMCCADVKTGSAFVLVSRTGAQVTLANGFFAGGWLNGTAMVGDLNTNPLAQPPYSLAYVASSSPTHVTSLGFSGKFVGTISG